MCRAFLIALLAFLVFPTSAVAAPGDAKRARAGLARAVEKGRLTPAEAQRFGAAIARAASLERRLPAAQAKTLGAVLAQVAQHSGRYTRPTALTLFSMLEVNADHLATNAVPPGGRDVEGPDGVVYRAFAGRGLQFHPLANAARLNAHVSAGRAAEAATLADALLARGVSRLGGTTWEYWFDFGGARAPWSSGMAQAVMAQAYARAGLAGAARRAFLPVPRLTMALPQGPWIKLYEGSRLVVLNAQLQAAVSVAEYAALSADGGAAAFAGRLRGTASALLSLFDTGYWSNYSPGNESTLDYQRYVVTLLRRLGRDTGEEHWREAAARFEAYEREVPLLKSGPPLPTLYPVPRDGHRDDAAARFWVSKVSDVTLVVAGKWRRTIRVGKGWHTLSWTVPTALQPGSYRAWLLARGLAGNVGRVDLPDVVVARDVELPVVSATVGGGALHWRAEDEGSDRLRLMLVLRGGGRQARVDLGPRPLDGAWRLQLPKGRWWGELVARDASGNATRVTLGRVR
ncbi:MAG: hypothetical protein ICV67_02490 [Thermoleophilia bacterium]|nr:hypothetical protein [Thermoleophilia bacterium]